MAGSWSASTCKLIGAISGFRTIQWTFTASADDGSVPDLVPTTADREFMEGLSFFMAETAPGGTAPQALYDITVEDASGDMFGGALANLAQTREFRRPLANAAPDVVPYDGRALTIKTANNNVNSATCTLRLYMWR